MTTHNAYRLMTAEIVYHMPDFPALLQSYTWQQVDLAPNFPALQQFLTFWANTLEGRIHSVRVATTGVHLRRKVSHADFVYTLH